MVPMLYPNWIYLFQRMYAKILCIFKNFVKKMRFRNRFHIFYRTKASHPILQTDLFRFQTEVCFHVVRIFLWSDPIAEFFFSNFLPNIFHEFWIFCRHFHERILELNRLTDNVKIYFLSLNKNCECETKLTNAHPAIVWYSYYIFRI